MNAPKSWDDVNQTSHLTWPDQIARIRAEYEARIAALEAENARLREAERTAWGRGLNAAASHVRCETAKWLTPEDRATPSGKMAGEYLDALSDEIAAITPASDGRVDGLREAAEIVRNRRNSRYKVGHEWVTLDEAADAILARAAELEKADE